MKYYWILDNGHGTPCRLGGKHSPPFPDGSPRIKEALFNRAVTKAINKRLNEEGMSGSRLVTEKEDVSLRERVNRANTIAINARRKGLNPLFVSVHANAHGMNDQWTSANGVEVWHYSNTGLKIGEVFQKKITTATGLRHRGVKRAYDVSWGNTKIYVLRYTSMPAILTENGFMTTLKEATKMKSTQFINEVAEAHIQAMLEIEKSGI